LSAILGRDESAELLGNVGTLHVGLNLTLLGRDALTLLAGDFSWLVAAGLDWDVSTLFLRDSGTLFNRDDCTLLLGNLLAVLVLYEVTFLQLHSFTDVSRDLSGDVLAILGRDSPADSSGNLGATLASHRLALLLRNTLAILPWCHAALLHGDVLAGSSGDLFGHILTFLYSHRITLLGWNVGTLLSLHLSRH